MLLVTLMTFTFASSGPSGTPCMIEIDWIHPMPAIALSYGSNIFICHLPGVGHALPELISTVKNKKVYIDIRKIIITIKLQKHT